MTHPEDVITTAEVCRLLKITRPTLYHWIEKGRITPWKKLGDGSTFLFLRALLTRKPFRKYSRNKPQNIDRLPRPDEPSVPCPLKSKGRGEAADNAWRETSRRGTDKDHVYRTAVRIVLVSQDKTIAEQTCSDLQNQGYSVSVAGNISQIERVLKTGEIPEIIVLDLDLAPSSVLRPDGAAGPGQMDGETRLKSLSGWKLFAEIKRLVKESNRPSPVYLLLSGEHTAPQDIANAFKRGAWDFLKKPMASSVFVARVRLALRRRFWSELDANPLGYSITTSDERLALDPNSRILKIQGSFNQPVFRHLTRKESELFCLLLKRPGMIFSKAMLLEIVWGYTTNIRTRTVDCHIKNLRQKLNPHGGRIETHYSSGYRFIDPPPARI